MTNMFSRSAIRQQLRETLSDPQKILDNLPEPMIPSSLSGWLSRLSLLHGVPFNYLVPDEGMLPPESIRFFYLDDNWATALTDGAFSIGRNLTDEQNSADLNIDKAVLPQVMQQVRADMPQHRARLFGRTADGTPSVITGFLLRSSLVREYPGMGVYAFPGKTADNALDILRFEQMGAGSDTLICLVRGDAARVDIHEAPQALHYGIDCYNDDCTVNGVTALAVKNLHTFSIHHTIDPVTHTKLRSVTMSTAETPTDISTCIRQNKRRVIDMKILAGLIAVKNQLAGIDSAEMGFEMTQGVGKVSFYKNTTP